MRKFKTFILFSMLFFFVAFVQKSFSQNAVLQAGIAKVDITPTENIYMGGYEESCRTGPSDGVYGKIYIRALVFDDNINRIVFVEADLVLLPPEMYSQIRKLISSETGIHFENIILGCVHNHSTPYPDERNKNSNWSKQLNNKFVSVVKNAIADLEPVKIGGGIGKSNIAMNRRKILKDNVTSYLTFDENNSSQSYGKYKTDTPVLIKEMAGVCRLGNNPLGSIDDEVGILRIDKISGEPKAVFVNYACHGVSLGCRNSKISPEWNGHMLNYIEKNIPGATGIFVQGAAGDIDPRFVGGLDGYIDDLEKTKALGDEIGKEVVKVFFDINTLPVKAQIKLVHGNITCPRKYAAVVENFRNTTLDIPITAIKIDEFTWVTFPGELFHEIGKNIKIITHSRFPFIAGYCNGHLGYLPTQQAYGEGGYEPWNSPFAPVSEKIFVEGIEKLLLNLY